jgi:hypothetical protein
MGQGQEESEEARVMRGLKRIGQVPCFQYWNSQFASGLETTDLRPERTAVMRVRTYVRVSKKALNTDNQLYDLRTFAASVPGWSMTGEYVETVTGSGLKQRKEFERMMLDASRHEFDLLLFWKLDRVSREGISATLRYLENLKAWGVGWRSSHFHCFNASWAA